MVNGGPDQTHVVEFLSTPSAYGAASGHVEFRETHISFIFLIGNRAYKMKKNVDLGYLDFSTLEKRRVACEAELSLNRRTAPQYYLDLVPVTQDGNGHFALDGTGPAIEWLVRMLRFDETRLATNLARRGELTHDMLEALAKKVAAFHHITELAPTLGGANAMCAIIESNHHHLSVFARHGLSGSDVETLHEESKAAISSHAEHLDERRAQGYVRRCHGDLHLGNIVMEAGGPVLFDCIEFSEEMASIDTLYDLAFLLMDLCHLDFCEGANRVLNSYLIASEKVEREANLNALSLLPFFLSCRAAVRAHVSAQVAGAHDGDKAKFGEAKRYLAEAVTYLDPAPPLLLAVGGLSGTGKSSLARTLASGLGPAPGAVILRSDELRKCMFGRNVRDRLGVEAYTEDVSRRVYKKMADDARIALAAGHAVIADAVHARPEERDAIEVVAQEHNVPFVGLWLDAPLNTVEQRLQTRTADASDATVEVFRRQLNYDLEPINWNRIDASRGLDDMTAAAHQFL